MQSLPMRKVTYPSWVLAGDSAGMEGVYSGHKASPTPVCHSFEEKSAPLP